MSDAIKINIEGRAKDLAAKIKDVPGAMAAVAKAIDSENSFTVSHIQAKYLSYPKQGSTTPLGCRAVTNRLRPSIRAEKAQVAGPGVVTSIGSNVKYAIMQEEGTAPHEIRAKNGGKLRFQIGEKVFFRDKVNHPGTAGRHFVRHGLTDRLPEYQTECAAAIVAFWEGEQQ